MEQILIVLAVLAFFGACLWFLRKNGVARFRMPARAHGRRTVEVVDRVALSPSHSIHLVRFADRVLVVGISPSGCNLLDRSELANFEQWVQSAQAESTRGLA